MQQRNHGKLSKKTAERLYEMIATQGVYSAGSKLPNEYALSEELGVSRTTLREAISFLAAQGVLEIHRGLGTFVRADFPDHGLDLTNLQTVYAKGRAEDLYEMRLIFEPAAVALACQRASDEELDSIRNKAEKMELLAHQGGDWAAADREFHLAIIKASHNEYMRRLYPIINDAVEEIMAMLQDHDQRDVQSTALADNRLILEFLLERDTQGAHAAMDIHMKHLLLAVGKI